MSKKALITGITGQDGSYLAELLLDKGYEVHGIIRRSSSFNTGRIEHLYMDELISDMKTRKKIPFQTRVNFEDYILHHLNPLSCSGYFR